MDPITWPDIVQGMLVGALAVLAIQAAWVTLLLLAGRLLWNASQKRIVLQGG